ncbi:uncharacterized protein LOC104672310 isoform X2 [Rhinopithecus roxellana]|uniref:uncharacterized protein LOC104672310 isoform X2 n=1 Tax=Rhinopithecus roxellana TaxID=61622 RepID=UPI00123768B4|nr:uncharacterized protein LOC104672310 isoform X2 [Rhinopithecus roxellana]
MPTRRFGHLQCSSVVVAFQLNWETASCSVPRQTLDLRGGSGCPENSLLVDSRKGSSRTKVRTTEVKATGYLSCPPLAANCTRRKTAPPLRSELTVFLHRPLLEKNNIKLASKELCTESSWVSHWISPKAEMSSSSVSQSRTKRMCLG